MRFQRERGRRLGKLTAIVKVFGRSERMSEKKVAGAYRHLSSELTSFEVRLEQDRFLNVILGVDVFVSRRQRR